MAGKINLTEEIKKYLEYSQFEVNQDASMHTLLEGNDTFVLMTTGGNKSLCY